MWLFIAPTLLHTHIRSRLKAWLLIAPTVLYTNIKQIEGVTVNCSYSVAHTYEADWRCDLSNAPTVLHTNTKQTGGVAVNCSYFLAPKYKADWRCDCYLLLLSGRQIQSILKAVLLIASTFLHTHIQSRLKVWPVKCFYSVAHTKQTEDVSANSSYSLTPKYQLVLQSTSLYYSVLAPTYKADWRCAC